jgi:hypothetical protein
VSAAEFRFVFGGRQAEKAGLPALIRGNPRYILHSCPIN